MKEDESIKSQTSFRCIEQCTNLRVIIDEELKFKHQLP